MPPSFARWPYWPDAAALAGLGAATIVSAFLLFYGGTLIGQDSATQFYPWYEYLGDRLRDGDIPGWNPYQFGGAPFAADPQSGWMYFPAMAIFSLLPLGQAVPTFIMFHLALAGVATYALGRVLRLAASGALIAAVSFQLSGPLIGRAVCCPASFEVSTWAPVALLGAELAIRAHDKLVRLTGWIIAGLAVSQALAAWLGQGAYYLLLMLGAFVAFRTLIAPAVTARALKLRVWDLLRHGGAILLIGFGLAAAGVLPRLAYIQRSNLAGGEYSGHNSWAAAIGGITPGMLIDRILDPTLYYPGAITVLLTISSVYLARRWQASGFFMVFGLSALLLAAPWDTPLHQLLYVTLPRFEVLHEHRPERISMVGFLAIAMLAGASGSALSRERVPRPGTRAVLGGAAGLALLLLALRADSAMETLGWGAAGLGLAGALLFLSIPTMRSVVPALLAVLIVADLLLGFQALSRRAPFGGFHRVDIESYYAPRSAAVFLEDRAVEGKGRYLGYDAALRAIADGQQVLYRYQFASDDTAALVVNNRGTLLGIEDIQGYNPVQPQRFTEYLTALNGHPQEYHDANVYFGGFNSPLLHLLNVRYIVIPANEEAGRPDLQTLDRVLPTVYEDSRVAILENVDAMPRAWIVHDARQIETGEALRLIDSGQVDPRQTALLEEEPPPLAPATNPAADRAELIDIGPDHLEIRTFSDAPGLLILSEAYDPGWRATIDGEETDVLIADHLLRAVPLPAGEHVVELRYAPPTLRIGLAITGITIFSLLMLVSHQVWLRWQAR